MHTVFKIRHTFRKIIESIFFFEVCYIKLLKLDTLKHKYKTTYIHKFIIQNDFKLLSDQLHYQTWSLKTVPHTNHM